MDDEDDTGDVTLSSLRDCLFQLSQGRITEKKRQLERLKMMLKREVVLQALDKNSAIKKKSVSGWQQLITWSKIFSCARSYIEQEAERLQERESNTENPSSNVIANRCKDKKNCTDVFRFIVNAISSRGSSVLSSGVCSKIIDHIRSVLSNSYTLSSFGFDYTNVLLKEILPVPQMCHEMSCEVYEEFLLQYIEFVKKPPAGWDRNILAQVLHQLLTKAYSQYDVTPQFLFAFFSSIFCNIKNEKATKYHEHLLRCLIMVCQNVGTSARVQLCELGEAIIMPLILLWRTKPTDSAKELMLEFLLMQLVLHHPQVATKEEDGAFAGDWSTWKTLLTTLYHLVIRELTEVCGKNKYCPSKELVLHPYFMEVAVKVCALVFQEACPSIEVTQFPSTLDISCSAIKRRRIDVGFKAFVSELQSFSSSEIVPWLQIISELFKRHYNIITLDEIALVINTLIDIHLSCSQIEVKTYLLITCQAAVEAFCLLRESSAACDDITCDWTRLWELGIKCVALMHQCHEAGHGLLAALLKYKLVIPKTEFLNLYRPGSNNSISAASLRTLQVYLQKFSLPVSLPSQTAGDLTDKNGVRSQLLSWMLLLPDPDDEFERLVSFLSSSDANTSTIVHIASVLLFLCLQDNKWITVKDVVHTDDVNNGIPSWIKELEKDLLRCNFDLKLSHKISMTSKSSTNTSSVETQAVWKQMSEFMLSIFSKLSDNLLNASCLNPGLIQLKMGCIIFLVLKEMCLMGAASEEDLIEIPLVNNVKDFLCSAVEALRSQVDEYRQSDLAVSHSIQEFLHFFSTILQSDKTSAEEAEKYPMLHKLYLKCLPMELLNILLNVLKMESDDGSAEDTRMDVSVVTDKGHSTDARFSPLTKPKQKRNRYDFSPVKQKDDFDIEIEKEDAGPASSNGITDEQNLLKSAKIRTECADLIAALFQLASSEQQWDMHVHSVARKLLSKVQVIKDSKKPDDVQLCLKLLQCVLLAKKLDDDDVQTVVAIMRGLLNKHNKSRTLCAQIVNLFQSIYPHVFSDGCCSSAISMERDHVIHMLSVLRAKDQDGKSNQDVVYSFAIALMHLIKHDSKATLSDMRNNTSSEPVPVLSEFAELLHSKHFKVSFLIASNVGIIYKSSADGGMKTFQEICSKYLQSREDINDQGDLSKSHFDDERRNHTTSMLWFLYQTYLDNLSCRKKVIFTMCQLIKNGQASEMLMLKLLKQLASSLGWPSLRDFIEPHFDFICYQWIKNHCNIEDLPLAMFEFDCLEDFLLHFHGRIVPLYVYQLEVKPVEKIAQKLDLDFKSLLSSCLPLILAHVYSWRVVEPQSVKASQCMELLQQNLSKDVIAEALLTNMVDIVICLFDMIEEHPENQPSHEDEGVSMTCSDIASISPDQFVSTIDMLRRAVEWKKSLVSFLCKKRDGLQKILLFMNVKLCKAHESVDVKQALLMYKIFIELLISDFGNNLKYQHTFLLTEIIYSLVNFVIKRSATSNDEESVLSIRLIEKLCEASLPHYKKDIGHLLPFMVSRLVPFVSNAELGKQVVMLLNFLVLQSCNHLEEYIASLDPFPDSECLQELKQKHVQLMYRNGPYTLQMEFNHFIQSHCKTGRATTEGLKHLHSQLEQKKEELRSILADLQDNRVFSNDVKNSCLHQLVCTLVRLCVPGSSSKEIQIEASRCLGEIGPLNLSTIVLQAESHFPEWMESEDTKDMSSMDKAYCHVFNLLIPYLKGNRVHLKVVVSEVLKNLFRTTAARQFFSMYGKASYDDWFSYLYPFQSTDKVQSCTKGSIQIEKINQVVLWAPDESTHSEWITNLVCTLIQSGITENAFFEQLIPLCREEPSFCGQLLPYLIHAIILRKNSHARDVISDHISSFFAKLSRHLEVKPCSGSSVGSTQSGSTTPFYECKASVQTMLSVVNYLRLQVDPGEHSGICSNSWTGLDLDYLHVAQAAQYCSAYFTAILFTELWCDSVRPNAAPSSCNEESRDIIDGLSPDSSPMTVLHTQDQRRVSLVYKILLEAYSNIGDVDGIHGCVEIAADVNSVVLNHYMAERKWDRLLSYHDRENNGSGVIQALRNCGLDHTLQNYLQSCSSSGIDMPTDSVEYQCECAWKLGQWDVLIVESEKPKFNECLYQSLQCLHHSNEMGFAKHLDMSRSAVFHNLKHTSLESLRSIMPLLSQLQMLVLLEDYSALTLNIEMAAEIQEKWERQKNLPYADCEFFEPISWLQCILLKQFSETYGSDTHVRSELLKCLENHAIKAREENHLEAAFRAIHVLKKSSLGSPEDRLRWLVEEAKILWTKQEHLLANRLLKSVIYSVEKLVKDNPDYADLTLTYAKALSLRGRWLGETCNENSSTIMKDYLEKAIEVLETQCLEDSGHKLWDAYLAVARYADNQYQNILNYKKSTTYRTKQELMINATEDMNKLKASKTLSEDQKKTYFILVRQLKIDEGELSNLDSDQQQFLMKAISGYLVCLKGTDAHDLWVFRLTALWFQNLENEKINEAIKQHVLSIETYKFLPLMYQLAARMGTPTSGQFSAVLSQLIKNIAIDHPHHALPVILSMSNSEKDPSEARSSGKSSGGNADDEIRKERTNAAKKLVAELKKSKIAHLVKDMSILCDAYISLAYMCADEMVRARQRTAEIPLDQPIMKIKNLTNIPVVTEDTKVDRSCTYDKIVGIHSFHSEFRLCGGVTVPKVIKCLGMDGVQREQLVKGRDDLRQDAVMQQVFSLVNCLLKENNETKKRKLHIRTYKVVPMSRRSGVLQWCVGTQCLSQYLIGPNPSGGAHKKYYPNFWSNLQCQKTMKSISDHSSLRRKREIYEEICTNYPPVFRYFFLENFPEPSAWFERQQSYTKSVAASSIVGYILGLGDRHVNNILIDKYTAEVVHIDFGIAFEKGRILATPETVPFRLTRDVVDGMGFVGVEGVFKRCCEKTLEVMRNSQDVLLTILEVFLYDPLYDWAVPSGKSTLSAPQLRFDGQSSSQNIQGVNKLAERALMRLQQKLQGLEEGMTLSISGQVNLLIQQARDPNNLCRLYAGWQPYL